MCFRNSIQMLDFSGSALDHAVKYLVPLLSQRNNGTLKSSLFGNKSTVNNFTVRDFIFLGSKITADGDCSHEIKRCILLGKSRDITLPTKVRLVKAMVFPVVMYGCESWTIKKAEHQRIDAFVLWCWRRLLRVPWTARRSN